MSEQKLYPVKLSCRRKSYSVQCEHCLIRELKQWRLDQQNRNFAHAAGFFVHFFDVDLKVPNFTVCGGLERRQFTYKWRFCRRRRRCCLISLLLTTYKRLLRGLRYYQLWVVVGALTKGSLSNDVGDSGENAKQQFRTVITFLFTFLCRKCTALSWKPVSKRRSMRT